MASLPVIQIAKELAAARKLRGLTQEQLADLLAVPQSYVSKIESGKTDIRTSKLIETARLLQFDVVLVPVERLPAVRMALSDVRERVVSDAMYVPDEDDFDEV